MANLQGKVNVWSHCLSVSLPLSLSLFLSLSLSLFVSLQQSNHFHPGSSDAISDEVGDYSPELFGGDFLPGGLQPLHALQSDPLLLRTSTHPAGNLALS